jgi:hypothetical protein
MAVVLAAGACASGPEAADAPGAASVAPSETDTAPTLQDIFTVVEPLSPVEPGSYFIDADLDPSTSSGSCSTSPPRDGRAGSERRSSAPTTVTSA